MLFNQRIGLIEATEELKRVNVDTKTFTQPIAHKYTDTAYYIEPQGVATDRGGSIVFNGETLNAVQATAEDSDYYFSEFVDKPDPNTKYYIDQINEMKVYPYRGTAYANLYAINEPISIKDLIFYFHRADTAGYYYLYTVGTTVSIKPPQGNEVALGALTKGDGSQANTYTPTQKGHYQVIYRGYGGIGGIGNDQIQNLEVTYTFEVVKDIILKNRKTITEVINTVLNYACGNRNRHYVLDPVYAEKWQNVVAPEFYFTRNTLYEVLLQIGGYRDIQAIPRLEWLDDNAGEATPTYSAPAGYTFAAPFYYERCTTLDLKYGVWKNGSTEYPTTITLFGGDDTGTIIKEIAPADNIEGFEESVTLTDDYNHYTILYEADGADGAYMQAKYVVYPGHSGLRLITFDDLNVESEWTPPGATTSDPYGDLITYHEEQSADDYFAGLDSYADNIIDNSVNGSIGLPSPYTPRCESGDLAVTDNTIIIETSMPIDSVQKVELFYKGDGFLSVVSRDLTPYIFKKPEYDLLTDYQGEFPTAKQYAFYYSQGARNIYGLTLKPEVFDFLGIAQEAQETAAIKVYEAVSGKEFDSATQKVIDFMYRVTYTPIQTRRLKQYRPLIGERPDWDISYYNQSANTLDAKNFGDNMKFMLLQKGNRLKVVTYRLTGDNGSVLEQIPKIGQTLNGAKICQVDAEYERYSVKVTLWLTEHYNRKSQYVEINAQKRFYEISERQSVLRQLNASYEYRIGKVDPDADKAIISADLVESFIKGTTPTNTNNRVAQAAVKMYTEDDGNGEQIGDTLLLPVSAIGFGNSISLHFEMTDNYSAGNQVIYKDGNINNVSLLRAVPYGDEYGEFISMTIGFLGGEIPWSILSTNGWSDYRKVGRALPEMEASLDDDKTPLFADVLNVAKDNREQISVDVQIHFRTDDSTIIIGSAFGERFPYVNAHIGTDDEELEWVELIEPIAPLQNRLAPDQYRTGSGVIDTEQGDGFVKVTQWTGFDPGNDGEGVALIVKNTGELIVGVNAMPERVSSGVGYLYGYFFGDNFCFPTKVKPL